MDYWSEGIGANQSVLRDHLSLRKNNEQGATSFPSLINLNVYGSTARFKKVEHPILNELLSLNPRKVSLSLVTPNQSTSNQNFLSSTLQAGGLANTARTYTIYSVPLIDVELDFLSSIFFRRISNSFLDSKNVGIKSINRKYLIFP
jgi:hypothetical protein